MFSTWRVWRTQNKVRSWWSNILGLNNFLWTDSRQLVSEPPQQGDRKFALDLAAALKECTKSRNLEGGKQLHAAAVASSCHTNKYVATALIKMYSKFGAMSAAREVFNQTVHKDVVLWSCLILGYAENGDFQEALNLFENMDCQPDSFSFVAALKACTGLAGSDKQDSLRRGMLLHKQLRERGFESNMVLASSLLDMYCKSGCMSKAREVFDNMPRRDVVAWNSLIFGYVDNGESAVALSLFRCMDCEPGYVTFIGALKACSGLAGVDKQSALQKGMEVHKQLKERRFDSNMQVVNTLVDMYGKCGDMHKARETFDRMVRRDVVSWNCLILGYVENGESSVALELYTEMDCEPTAYTFIAALKACGDLAGERVSEKHLFLKTGTEIHRQLKKQGSESNLMVANTLVDMYCKCGNMTTAREVFNRIPYRNAVSWTSLMHGYVENGDSAAALELFGRMDCEPDAVAYVAALKASAGLASEDGSQKESCLERGVAIHEKLKERGLDSNVVAANSVLDMYSKCGKMALARAVFDGMPHRDAVSWTCLVLGYVENGDCSKALEVFSNIDCEPDCFTFHAALKACGTLSELSFGQSIHARICRRGVENDSTLATSLVDFYGKCSKTVLAEHVFNGMQSRDIGCWNALTAGYSMLGDTDQVFSIACDILEVGLQMTNITVISILTACSHAGKVEQGKRCFESMSVKYGVTPTLDHYTCMTDMLGRANRLPEALSVVQSMPLKADPVTWRTLLGACRKWNNPEVGNIAFDALVACDTKDSASYVLMGDLMMQNNKDKDKNLLKCF